MAKESQNIERTGKIKFPSTFLPLLLAAALFAATPAAFGDSGRSGLAAEERYE